jgi:hypothetical protein
VLEERSKGSLSWIMVADWHEKERLTSRSSKIEKIFEKRSVSDLRFGAKMKCRSVM